MAIKKLVRSGLRALTAIPPLRAGLRLLTSGGVVPESVWKRLPIQTRFTIQTPDGRRFDYESLGTEVLARQLYWRGLSAWEPGTTMVFYEFAKGARWFLDLGANTGIYSMLACAANPAARVVAFEPVPFIHARLVNNLRINRWEQRCDARHEAAADAIGRAKFHIPRVDMPASSSLVQGFRGWSDATTVDVELTTVDAVVPADAQVDLVKIDVEGAEDKALGGMTRILSTCRPAIVIECLPEGPCQRVEQILRGFGYSFFHLRDSAPVPMSGIVPDGTDRFRNYLCTTTRDWRESVRAPGAQG